MTKGESEEYPCNTVSGDKVGKPCNFPFVFPDCSVKNHINSFCTVSNESKTYYECPAVTGIGPWCSTRNYLNGSWMFGEWGYCDERCTTLNLKKHERSLADVKSDDNLDWEESFDYFFGPDFAGHCHTYNPKHESSSGHLGQLYAFLGLFLLEFDRYRSQLIGIG